MVISSQLIPFWLSDFWQNFVFMDYQYIGTSFTALFNFYRLAVFVF